MVPGIDYDATHGKPATHAMDNGTVHGCMVVYHDTSHDFYQTRGLGRVHHGVRHG